ncbi:50S ribosomal protein L14e [Candidatus Bathyarchaeota archaeon]|nr:50S ribosomal protein L14e [Candidatus Bathyarchaeota archaeon]MBS7627497.1 50S ribosomal protein L14e [Candidatus Bathyarchaeota archaeon]
MAEVGRICVKTKGRERGKKCVIVDIIDEHFVLITGPKQLTGVRRRRANLKHLSLMEMKANLHRGASDEEVLKAIEEAGLKEVLSGGS